MFKTKRTGWKTVRKTLKPSALLLKERHVVKQEYEISVSHDTEARDDTLN
jgi:hypothetical protein